MKQITLLLMVFVTVFSLGQNPQIFSNTETYNAAKANGTLDQFNVIPYEVPQIVIPLEDVLQKGDIIIPPKATGCLKYEAPVGFTSTGIMFDDQSTASIPLNFNFCFYGDTVNSIYINANGNITFNAPLLSYSSTAFPSATNQILAPFWADVDVTGGGTISYIQTATSMIINWHDVGYYSGQGDKRNSFSLVITDGNDPIINGGNVAFLYGDMQWTTGSASSGTNGFGGIPATCGANKGDNVSFFLIAQFDHPGSDFDGALGNPDGISWLDNRSFYFDFCTTSNVAPVPLGIGPCDTITLCALGDTADIPFIFLSPEANQTTTITVTSPTLTNLQVVSNVPGNTANAMIRLVGTSAFVGTHNVNVTATDNFSTPGITSVDFTVIVDSSGNANFNPVLAPVAGCDSVVAFVQNGPYDSYLWDDFLLDSSHVVNQSGYFGVTVELNGCYKKVSENFIIGSQDLDFISTDFSTCPNALEYIEVKDSADFATITWGVTGLDNDFSVNLPPGTYTATATNQIGCVTDSTFTITSQPKIVLNQQNTLCGDSADLDQNLGVETGIWSMISGPGNVVFYPNDSLQTNATFDLPGTYYLTYAEPLCNDADTLKIDVTYYAFAEVANQVGCEGTPITVEALDFWGDITNYVWSNGETGPVATILEGGNHFVTVSNQCGAYTYPFFFDAKDCKINMPNVFSPNGDEVNEFYGPISPSVESFTSFKCQIFNRWGNLMYEFTDMTKGWDGDKANEGVYFYHINAVDADGVDLDYQGFFQLVLD